MSGCTCRSGPSLGEISAKEFVKTALESDQMQSAIRYREGKVNFLDFPYQMISHATKLYEKGFELPTLDDMLKELKGLTIELDKNWRILDKEKVDKEIYDRIYGKMDFEAMRNKRKNQR